MIASAALIAAFAAPSQAATTFGSNLAAIPNGDPCGFGSFHESNRKCFLAQISSLPGHSQAAGLTAPAAGVVVRWRVRIGTAEPGTDHAQARLRTVRGGVLTGGGGLPYQPLPLNQPGIKTFATRLPVQAGDLIGIDQEIGNFGTESAALPIARFETGFGFALRSGGALVDGAEITNEEDDVETLINADLEPDADLDGYGDETQDLCPTNQLLQVVCPDRIAPRATASFATRQNFLKSKNLIVRLISDEAGTAAATGKITIKGSAKSWSVAGASAAIVPGKKLALRLRVPRKTRKAVAKALADGKKAKATVTAFVVDAAGNRSSESIATIRPIPPPPPAHD